VALPLFRAFSACVLQTTSTWADGPGCHISVPLALELRVLTPASEALGYFHSARFRRWERLFQQSRLELKIQTWTL